MIFQNSDNRHTFLTKKIVKKDITHLVNGSGVDIRLFQYKQIDVTQTKFLLIARLLKDKGLSEYIEAAKIVKHSHPNVVFELLGPEDPSPNAYPIDRIEKHHRMGIIKYLGETKNVIPYLEGCQIFVLPSYHEGLPRTVLEAMAIGRPILTTLAPGCKDTVLEAENGFLVPIKNKDALAQKMIWYIENRDKWQTMGRKSRQFAEQKFDVHKVNSRIIEILGIQQ